MYVKKNVNSLNIKLDCVDSPSYHLGGDFFWEPNGILAWIASTYVKKMFIHLTVLFDDKPKEQYFSMRECDRYELGTTDEIFENGIKWDTLLIVAL
jgi:hypothetical protein